MTVKGRFEEEAKEIFHHNLFKGFSNWKHTKYNFIAPAKVEYTYQWLWDTAFHAIVLSHFDTAWAKREINNFLLGQWENGFIPHIIFWGNQKILPHWAYIESKGIFRPRTSALTQPPMLAIAVEEIYKKDGDLGFLYQVLPKLSRYYRHLLEHRDPDGDHLISIISPNESGMDELPVFQLPSGYLGLNPTRLRYVFRKIDLQNKSLGYNPEKILQKDYFNVEELLFNCVYIQACRALARLFDQIHEEQAKIKTVASLMPLFLDGIEKKQLDSLIADHLLNPEEFWTNFPIPSVAKNEFFYVPQEIPSDKISHTSLLWRGPTWVSTNWFIVKGLRKHGQNKIADIIVAKMVEMIEKWGFREFYNPETGEGYRREDFGWSTLIVDLL